MRGTLTFILHVHRHFLARSHLSQQPTSNFEILFFKCPIANVEILEKHRLVHHYLDCSAINSYTRVHTVRFACTSRPHMRRLTFATGRSFRVELCREPTSVLFHDFPTCARQGRQSDISQD